MIIRVIFGLLTLGGGFNRHFLRSTPYQIYDTDDISKNLEVIPKLFIESRFLVPKTSSEVNKFLHIEPEFSLLSRWGGLKIDTYNDYVSSVIDRETTVDILFSVYVEVETRTFDPAITRLQNTWQGEPQSKVGTHYVESILYGRRLLINYRLTPFPEYVEEIKALVAKYLGHRGKTDDISLANIEKLEKEIGNKASRLVGAYTTGSTLVVTQSNLTGVLRLVKGYPKEVQEIKKDNLVPLAIDVEDLHNIQENFTDFWIYPGMHKVLSEIDERYEDLLIAQKRFNKWKSTAKFYKQHFTDEQEAKISAYAKRLEEVQDAMDEAIRKRNLMDTPWQFDDALSIYEEGGDGSYKYRKALKELIESLSQS